MSENNQLICTRCGSPRVQSNKSVRQSANPLYPITITQYRCTNDDCQADTERKQAELLRQRLEREERSRNNPNRRGRKD
jgi:hypothetical protein